MNKNTKLAIFILTSLITAFLLVSCSSSAPRVVPDVDNVVDFSEGVERSASSGDYDSSLVLLNYYYASKVDMIELAFGFYCDAYGYFPDNPSDLLDEFIPFWPGNPFQEGEPVKFIQAVPDISNPNDRGNIFYEKTGDLEAKLYFVNIDYRNSSDDQTTWMAHERSVFSDWNEYLKAPENEKWKTVGASLVNLDDGARFNISYERNVSQMLTNMVLMSTYKNGQFSKSISKILDDSDFYVINSGWQKMSSMLGNDIFQFEVGVINPDGWIYFYNGPDSRMSTECYKIDFNDSPTGTIQTSLNCYESDSNKIVYITSEDLGDVESKSDRIISKGDIY